jgi:glucosamine--fructose-6-phosphate aminotransferase (isomerizing)
MCGISCSVGNNSLPFALAGLKALSYRGYDSFGFAAVSGNKIFFEKQVGKVDDFVIPSEQASVCISHTRWATHGVVSKENAHPHFSCDKKIAVVHNGIIENFSILRKELESKGHFFVSQTDTEVIPHFLEEQLKQEQDFAKAFVNVISLLQGKFAIVAMFAGSEELFAATNSPPLIVGLGKGRNFLASDINAFLRYSNSAVFLKAGQFAKISKNKLELFDAKTIAPIAPKLEYLDWSYSEATKGEFEHFMLKEIFEQPAALKRTVDFFVSNRNKLIGLLRKNLPEIDRIVFVACGTSYYAGLIGERYFEQITKINTECEYASEFVFKRPLLSERDLVIAISQSGETADTLEAVKIAKKAGATILSLLNVEKSSIGLESDIVFPLNAGTEIGVASTKAFSCFLVGLYCLSVLFASARKNISEKQEEQFFSALHDLPEKMQEVLLQEKQTEKIAKDFCNASNALFLGRGINYPIALEGALKLKEISYIHAEGYPAAEMKHGPIALIDEKMPVFFIALNDSLYAKTISNIQEVRARKGKIISIATKGDNNIYQFSDAVFFVPATTEFLSPLLAVLPLQLIAYHIARFRGCSIDKPRNLAKSVTVE